MYEISISEYGYIGCDGISTAKDKFIGDRNLEKALFQELYNYWLENKESQKVFSFENKNCLKATSYVGVIQTKNLSIEILPKIYNQKNKLITRNIFIEMLKPLFKINSLMLKEANLSTVKNKNIYEIFISLFIESVDKLIHRGLKSHYHLTEANQYFLKGKLKFNQHIKENFIHKERFFVEFDEYMQDRAENRLIKSTILLLINKTKKYENKKALRQQLFIFDDISLSNNYDRDIAQINLNRGMEHYETALKFAKLFLKENSFSSLRGDSNIFAILFSMEKVFENYIEFVLYNSRSILNIKKIVTNGYSGDYLLKNESSNLIGLEPDYLLEMEDGTKIITDAKWKLLEVNNNKIDISSSDAYQIFSYLHFYNAQNKAYIFVPRTSNNRDLELNYNIKLSKKSIKIITIDILEIIKNNHILKNNFFEN